MSPESPFHEDLVKELLRDRKRDRHWRNFRFFVWIAIVVFILFQIVGLKFSLCQPLATNGTATKIARDKPYVSLVRLSGTIMPDKNFSARNITPNLTAAFEDKDAKGVVLVINSPGGSAVQSSIIHDRILYLKEKYHKKVVVIGEDALTSGAYLISVAADEIYVNPDTITGSIGVVLSSFGFNEAIAKLGVTRRLFTAGTDKARLDSFKPLDPADVRKIKGVLNQLHGSFIANVKEGRKGKLKGSDKELFSGDFWSGTKAVQLGLVDGTGNIWTVLKKEFDVSYYIDYSEQPSLFQSLFKGVQTSLETFLIPSMSAETVVH